MHYVNEHTLQKLENRYSNATLPASTVIDPKISKLVSWLNTIPGVTTVYSGSGYTKEEALKDHELTDQINKKYFPGKRKPFIYDSNQSAYVTFAITEEAQPFLKIIFGWLMNLNQYSHKAFRPQLTMLRLPLPIEINDPRHFAAFRLEAFYNSKERDAQVAVDLLLEVVEEYRNATVNTLEAKEYTGTIELTSENESKVLVKGLLDFVTQKYSENYGLSLSYRYNEIDDGRIHAVMSPFYLLEFVDPEDVRVVYIRDTEEYRRQVIALYGTNIDLIINLKDNNIKYTITGGTDKADRLLRHLKPELFK